jgi:peptidoglycan/xylan/chitin deacetylase (PgdA/CDA1 family)
LFSLGLERQTTTVTHLTLMVRRWMFLALRLTMLPFLIRELIQRKRVTIITYHDPSPDVFDEHLKVLRSVYSIIALDDYIDAMQRGRVSALPPKALIITLDDGHRGNHALKPILEKHQVPVTIFLCSGLVGTRRRFWFRHEGVERIVQQLKAVSDEERLAFLSRAGFEETKEFAGRQALSAAEVEELKTSVQFQSHSVFHPILPRCVPSRAWAEIVQSREDLQAALATEVYAFAYPDGQYSERELVLLRRAGYKCGLSLDLGFNSANTPRFRLRRISLSDTADRHELLVKTSGVWGAIRAVIRNWPSWRPGQAPPHRPDADWEGPLSARVPRASD